MKKKLVFIALIITVFFMAFLSYGYSQQIKELKKDISGKEYKIVQLENLVRNHKKERYELQKKYDEYKKRMEPYEELEQAEAEERKRAAEEAKAKAEEEKKAKEEAEKQAKAKAEEEARLAREAEEKQGYETGITYDQLARTPDDYTGKKVKFYGRVLQVLEGDDDTQIRLAVNGDYNSVLYCELSKKLTSSRRILEDDMITVYGLSAGVISYESTMGQKITIPGVLVNKYE